MLNEKLLPFKMLDEIPSGAKRALVRLDLNVPVDKGVVTDTTRIQRIKPTIDRLLAKNIQIVMCSHFGRPKANQPSEYSLRQISPALKDILGADVLFLEEIGAALPLDNPRLVLLENTRFYVGEAANDLEFAEKLAAYGDVYVNDAFSASHRAHASICAITQLLPAYAGIALQQELAALSAGLEQAKRPLTAIIGGAKISTKTDLLYNLIEKVDNLVIGGGMANSFLAARHIDIGKSLYEPEVLAKACEILDKATRLNCNIILPIDVVIAYEFAANANNNVVSIDNVPKEAMILDIGPATVNSIIKVLEDSATVIWNGPLGAFELKPFDRATINIAQWIAQRTKKANIVSIAGGGDTIYALDRAGVLEQFTYVSTAGGAFLEWMEGKNLPGIIALSK